MSALSNVKNAPETLDGTVVSSSSNLSTEDCLFRSSPGEQENAKTSNISLPRKNLALVFDILKFEANFFKKIPDSS